MWFSRKIVAHKITDAGILTQTGEALLQYPLFESVIPTLKQHVSADDYYFNALYQQTISDLLSWCQTLPKNRISEEGDNTYNKSGGLFFSIFDRVIAGLKLRQGELMPKGEQAETIAKDEPLWTYLVFSHVLLHYITEAILEKQRKVVLHKATSDKIGTWHPLAGSLYENNTYYRLHFSNRTTPLPPRQAIVSVLVGRWIPDQALRWMLKNKQAHQVWWDGLLELADCHNPFIMMIDSIDQKFAEKLKQRQTHTTKEQQLTQSLSKAFITWLVSKLCLQALSINTRDNHCHRVAEGMLVVLENILPLFLIEHPHFQSVIGYQDSLTQAAMKNAVKKLQKHSAVLNIQQGYYHDYAINQEGKTIHISGIVVDLETLYQNKDDYPELNPSAKRIVKGATT